MLLDEKETTAIDLLDESTIQKKKLLSVFWIIVGILGFLLGLLIMTTEILNPITDLEKKFLVWFIASGMSAIFGMLTFFGFKTRFSLNEQYDNQKIILIPKYEIYFWLSILIYISLITYFLRDEFPF